MNYLDDEQWLAALAGKPDPAAPAATNAQAHAVRKAMLARRAEIEAATEQLDPAELQRLQDRLEKEGLLSSPQQSQRKLPGWLSKLLPMKDGHVAAIPVWSLAANVVLAVVVVVQMGRWGAVQPETDVLRGSQGTVLRVANPQARLAELAAGLDAAKARYVVQRTPEGELVLYVQADDAALDYLIAQRIEPQAKDGLIIIRLKAF